MANPMRPLTTSPARLIVLAKAPSDSSLAAAELVGRAEPEEAEAGRDPEAAAEAVVAPEPTEEALALPGAEVGAARGAVDCPAI